MTDINKRTTCVACGNEKDNNVFTASEKMFRMWNEFDYLECSKCKSLQIITPPEDLSEYYVSEYYAFQALNSSDKLRNIFKRLRWLIYKWGIYKSSYPEYLRWLYKLKASEYDTIADIGCGNGQLIYEMRCSGFKKLYGFDPYLNEEVDDNGLRLYRVDITGVHGKYDIVMLNHSFEHMEYPQLVWQHLNEIVKTGGKLLIRLPVTDGEVWKTERTDWFQLDAPRHFFIPSVNAMAEMGRKNGFNLYLSEFDSTESQFMFTFLYKEGKSFINADLNSEFSKEERKKYNRMADKYNIDRKGDQVCLYYEKVE